MTGIKDIAKKAGVSISTVSYALNGSERITEQTRQKVLKIAKEMNYIPSLAGRGLKKQKTQIIEMYVTDLGGYFYSHLLDGVASTLKKQGYELIVASGGQRAQAFISQKLVDGAIILDPTFPSQVISKLAQDGNKLVLMDRELKLENVSHVLLNNTQGATQAVNELLKSGADAFAILTGPKDSYDAKKRMEAALDVFHEKTDQPVMVMAGDFTIESGRKAAVQLSKLCQAGHRVGVFATNDEMAFGLYEGLKKQNLQPGKDVLLVGFDNDLLANYLQPTLTTVGYSKHQWGRKAAEVILKMIDQDQVFNEIIPTKIIERESLGPKN